MKRLFVSLILGILTFGNYGECTTFSYEVLPSSSTAFTTYDDLGHSSLRLFTDANWKFELDDVANLLTISAVFNEGSLGLFWEYDPQIESFYLDPNTGLFKIGQPGTAGSFLSDSVLYLLGSLYDPSISGIINNDQTLSFLTSWAGDNSELNLGLNLSYLGEKPNTVLGVHNPEPQTILLLILGLSFLWRLSDVSRRMHGSR